MVNGAWLKSNFQFQVLKTTTVDLNMKAMVRTNHNTLVICNNKTLVTNNNNFNNKEDGYLFGPCSKDIVECEAILRKCRFAQHRDKYCFSRDAHFCALIEVGNYRILSNLF